MAATPSSIAALFRALAHTAAPLPGAGAAAVADLPVLLVLLQCRVLLPGAPLRLNALCVALSLSMQVSMPSSNNNNSSNNYNYNTLRTRALRIALAYLLDPAAFEPPVAVCERWLLATCLSFNAAEASFSFDIPLSVAQKSAADIADIFSTPSSPTAVQLTKNLAANIKLYSPVWHQYLHSIGASSCVVVPRVFMLPCTDVLDPSYSDVSINDALNATVDIFCGDESLDSLDDQIALSEFDFLDILAMPPLQVPGMDQVLLFYRRRR
ncbi:hypothetical protein BDR26DRAFT_168630 [Obelidium mucronatum]|nr:hypothetical protein BDR26DRAFT_168630 [Obelidium mucronatum]